MENAAEPKEAAKPTWSALLAMMEATGAVELWTALVAELLRGERLTIRPQTHQRLMTDASIVYSDLDGVAIEDGKICAYVAHAGADCTVAPRGRRLLCEVVRSFLIFLLFFFFRRLDCRAVPA